MKKELAVTPKVAETAKKRICFVIKNRPILHQIIVLLFYEAFLFLLFKTCYFKLSQKRSYKVCFCLPFTSIGFLTSTFSVLTPACLNNSRA